MQKVFRNSATHDAPQAALLFYKFHVMPHLDDALNEIRKSEYSGLVGMDRSYIKGQKYTLLSCPETFTLARKRAPKKLLAASNRCNTACLLKESFGQMRDHYTDA